MSAREIRDHIVENDSVNHQLEILVVDEPGSGGASHHCYVQTVGGGKLFCKLEFQNRKAAS